MRRIQRPSLAIAAPIKWTPPTVREALKEIALDMAEGADMLMVKPALAYMDVIWPGEGSNGSYP
jgi:hypothetical protein